MALTEKEELELLTLEKEAALVSQKASLKKAPLSERAIANSPESSRVADVLRNAAVEGLAGIPDTFLNAPSSIYNLGKAAVGMGMSAANIDPKYWPDVSSPPSYTSALARKLGATSEENEPKTTKERLLAAAMQSGVGMLGSGGVSNAGKNLAVGGLSGLAAQGTKEYTGSDLGALAVGAFTPSVVRGGARLVRGGAESMMEHAISPTLVDLQRKKVGPAIDTFLEKGIGPTKKGIAQLKNEGEILNDAAQSELARNGNKVLIRDDVAANALHPLMNQEQRVGGYLSKRLRGIQDEYDTMAGFPRNIPIEQANDIKRNYQQQTKYGIATDGADDARKAIARELRLQIEQNAPGVAPINAEASKIWNAVNVGERRALLHGKEQPLGIGVLSGNPTLAAAYAAQRNPWILTRLAQMLDPNGMKELTKPVSTQARLMQNALMAKQLEDQGVQE